MARRQLVLLVLSGYVTALLPVLWARFDMLRIPRSIWRYAPGPRPLELWRGCLLAGYVLGGWPGLLVAVVWRFSGDRKGLREEWAHLHRRNVEAIEREQAAATAPPDPLPVRVDPKREPEHEIVLADYEDEGEAGGRATAPAPVRKEASTREDAPPAPG
jgi:hypothetical protein